VRYDAGMLAAVVATVLALAPYRGPAQRGALPGSRSFALSIAAQPGKHLRLRAVDVPAGFVAAFCTSRICAPFAVPLLVPPTGRTTIEMQLVRNDDGATTPRTVTVASDDGARAAIAYRRGTMPAR
jgi:hypothetical protein